MKLNECLLIAMLFILANSCSTTTKDKSQDKDQLPTPKFQVGVAKFSGYIENYKDENLTFSIGTTTSVLGEREDFTSKVDQKGNFFFEIPLETNYSLVGLYCNELETGFMIVLSLEDETIVNLRLDESQNLNLDIKQGIPITVNLDDFQNSYIEMVGIHEEKYERLCIDTINRFIQEPDYFVRYHLNYDFNPRLETVKTDTIVSKAISNFLIQELNCLYIGHLLTYPLIIAQYTTEINSQSSCDIDNSPKEMVEMIFPPRSYYAFLKDLKLNDSQYLYTSNYSKVVQDILTCDSLCILPIENMKVDQWLADTKDKIADLLGFDQGLFYDMLVVAAYNQQFIQKIESLSEFQIQNLKDYYKGGMVEQILMRKNEEIKNEDDYFGEVNIHETPQAEKGKLLDAIVSKHKGKVVVVDLWGTWCGPCLLSMSKFKSSKNELNRNSDDLVFVYVAAENSPQYAWMQIIKNIDGEHYYITNAEWDDLLNTIESC